MFVTPQRPPINVSVAVKFDLGELVKLPPDKLDAIMGGIAKVIAAGGAVERVEAETKGRKS